MPFYKVEGSIPKKRHTVFKNPKGGIYYEEHVSREGFSYMYSNLYHLNMPTQISAIKQKMNIADKLKYEKGSFGGYQAIMKKNGVYYGASESRKDGQAAGY